MATKDITDLQVVQAVHDAFETGFKPTAAELLAERTGQSYKVCCCAIERAYGRSLIECGVSMRTPWVSDEGKRMLKEQLA